MFYLRDAAYALQSELALPSDQPPFDVVLTPASATLTRGPKNKNHGSSWVSGMIVLHPAYLPKPAHSILETRLDTFLP